MKRLGISLGIALAIVGGVGLVSFGLVWLGHQPGPVEGAVIAVLLVVFLTAIAYVALGDDS